MKNHVELLINEVEEANEMSCFSQRIVVIPRAFFYSLFGLSALSLWTGRFLTKRQVTNLALSYITFLINRTEKPMMQLLPIHKFRWLWH